VRANFKLKLVTTKFATTMCVCLALGASAALGVRWWLPRTSVDFEQCSENAEQGASSKDERTSLMAMCDKLFAGRRKIGGGYTYYDFLQNRHFDIAGPNPTPKELKQLDQEYLLYLDAQRREAVAASIAQKQQEGEAQVVTQNYQYSTGTITPPGPPLTITPNIPGPTGRSKVQMCRDASLSCNWTKFSTGIRTIFGSFAKANRP
jgi:hypothetical protein